MRSASGDPLLYAISARRDVAWSAFRATCDSLLTLDPALSADMRGARSLAAAIGDSLGHWDLIATDDAPPRICIAPPVLARLPWPGLPRAVLCGARAPDTPEAVAAAAAQSDATVKFRTTHSYAPTRIEVTGASDTQLAALADALMIPFAAEPPAWSLAIGSGRLDQYLDTLQWEPHTELNWPRQEFDPERLAFGPLAPAPVAPTHLQGLRLVSYQHPAGWTRRDRLILNGRSAPADRSWARYAVLAYRGQRVLRADRRAGTVTVPRQLPLPNLLARALTLCSGVPPRTLPGAGLGLHGYSGVPASIMEAVMTRVWQSPADSDRLLEGALR